ncbi:MAG: ABC transporter permease [Mycobacteriales bacterium]
MTAATVTAPAPESDTARVSPLEGLRHTATLAWRTLVQIKHNPMELLDFSVQPLMFVLLFTYVFGGAIAGGTHAYLQFALAGIIIQNGLFATLNTGVGLNSDLEKGVFDRLRSLPIARYAPLAGRIVADLVKQAWAITLLLVVGLALGFRVHHGVLGVLGVYALVLGFALGISWVSVLVGVVASSAEKVQIFGFTTMFPITMISNAYVKTNTMPGWLQAWVKVNPVTSLADATRGLLVSGPVATPVLKSMLWAVAFTVVFAPLAVRALRRKV